MGLCASTPVVENEKSRKHSHGSFKRATTLDAHNVTETAVKNILRHRHRQVVHDGHKTEEFKRGSHLSIPAKEISAPYVPPKASANGISESNFDNADFGREVIEKYSGDNGKFENF